jgi:hypothetical protein
MVAEVVIIDKTDAYGRWFADGSWSAWQFIADGVRDASVAALEDDGEPAVLVGLVVLTPPPAGGLPYLHVLYQRVYYRLSASGVVAVGL